MKLFVLALVTVASLAIGASPAMADSFDPTLGLTDYVFSFGGVGTSATFSGDDTMDVFVTELTQFTIHVEDCCVVGDEWDLVLALDGGTVGWDIITSGDGSPNGGAFVGAPGSYFEAMATVTLSAGLHTIDLTQTAGIGGGAYLNISSGTAVVPEPGTMALSALGALGLLAVGRRRRK